MGVQFVNENVYMSLTFMEIDMDLAERIISATRKEAAGVSFSVYFGDPDKEDDYLTCVNAQIEDEINHVVPICINDACDVKEPHAHFREVK